MMRVLIVDGDVDAASRLTAMLSDAGIVAEVANETFAAIERLREQEYAAVVLDPMIRQHLNGYIVLNFLELEQPEMLPRLFLLTGMSEQTIRRTAPSAVARLFRKPASIASAAAAVIRLCTREVHGSVLLVEDDEATAVATTEWLEQLGYTVEHAHNGAEACDVLSKRDFDAVVLDLVLPTIDGFTLIDQFHDARPGLLRRTIVTTGMPDRYVEAIDRAAIGGFIRKPLDLPRLEELLRRVSARRGFEPGGEVPMMV
ncbi:MAG TPA: response regulator [Thermoanaerobaculia bacterium]|nr:response regulator [Thermoanaerobaculia bacterium]